MRRLFTLCLCTTLLGMLSLTACKKEDVDAREKRVKDEPTIDIGARVPDFRNTRNDTVGVVLYPSAMLYFIDTGLVQSEDNIKSIKRAMKQHIPIRVKVYEDNPNEIAAIYPATEEDLAKYRESLQEGN